MLHILPRNAWDQELLDVEAAAKQAGISEVVMVTGLLQVNGGGSPVSITGVAERETNRIVMRVDSRKKTASELGLHEIAHFRSTRENVEAFAAAVQDSGDGWRDTLEEYRERYKGAANNYEGMTPEDADLYVWEEIMGDAYAGIDCFGQTASQYHTEAVRAIDGGSGAIPAQEAQRASSAIQKETSAASERKTGPPARFSYAGRNANGANLESLREAQEMQAAGTDMESIRKATGWHEGMDGKWRWEIDDSRMQLRTDAADIPNYTTLGELVDAPELFEAYPDMADLSVTLHTLEDGQNGGYSRKFDSIELSRDLKNRPEALLNSLIHEVQHAIQNREEFASGANPAYWNRRMENGFDSRTAEERREGARLQEQYEQIRESDPQFVAAMEELDAMAPKVPRGKVDLNTWEQIEPDPPEWVRYDERRDQLEEQYGDRVWDWYSLRDSIDRNARNGGRMPTDLYRDTAGEIEARDAANRRPMSSETRKRIKPDYGNGDTVFANGEDSYSVGETDDGRAVAVVDNDILSHIDTSTWDSAKKAQAKAAAKTALLAFEDGIQVNGSTYKVNRTSRREYTRSEDTERLARRTPDAFADKMRAADIADDIITATTSWAKDGKLKHPRRDSFVDFTHGDVLIQAEQISMMRKPLSGSQRTASMCSMTWWT